LIQINPALKRKPYSFGDLEKALVMTKPITDKAEVAVEYPDKLYIGTFAHTARFDAHIDRTGISLTLELACAPICVVQPGRAREIVRR
jgi:hypothetical protein